jgi:hypothetical protein
MYSDREPNAASWQMTTTQTDRERLRRLLAILKPGESPQTVSAAK